MRTVLTGALLLLLPFGSALAKPPPNADMSLAPWFQSLKQPGTEVSCCSIADCRPAQVRYLGSDYEVFVAGKWRVVPKDTILHRMDNPTGQAVVCYAPYLGITCFIRGPES